MTRGEEVAVVREWSAWSVGKPSSNQAYADFFFEVVRAHPELRHLNAFEVLDVIVNAAPPVKFDQAG